MSLYLDLLKRSLIGWPYLPIERTLSWPHTGTDEARLNGQDWPLIAHTMLGMKRLNNIEDLCIRAINDDIPGDFCECGVWRGGATILMAGIVREFAHTPRQVYVCDSFAGVPAPSPDYPQDRNMTFHQNNDYLGVSAEEVAVAFIRYNLDGPNISLVEGLFKDTLPGPIGQLSVLRIDGDLYESAMDVLNALYDRVSPGGYVIVDDYGNVPPVREATDDFRRRYGVTTPMTSVDWSAVWWQKE